jgi:ribonuclease HI
MLLYIAATYQVVSTVLIVEREEVGKVHGAQRAVYYLGEVLTPAKQRYPHHQKLAYVVWMIARKLRHYFAENPIIVVTEAPLKNILTNPDATGRVCQWAIELAPHNITYVNRTAIKSQVLPNLFVDWMQSQTPVAPDTSGFWTMYFDGSKRNMGAGAGVVLVSPQGDKMKYVLRMNFPLLTNNEAEYETLLHGMHMEKACGATRLEIYGDSNLVVQQSINLCDVVSDNMVAYREMYRLMEGKFERCELKHIGRASNEEADTLANIGSTSSAIPDGVFYEVINQRSVKVKPPASPTQLTTDSGAAPEAAGENVTIGPSQQVLLIGPVWTRPFLAYLLRQELPEDPAEARCIAR